MLCDSAVPYIYNMSLHGNQYQWFEERMGWTSAVTYGLLSGLNVHSFKAKLYLDQGSTLFAISTYTCVDVISFVVCMNELNA